MSVTELVQTNDDMFNIDEYSIDELLYLFDIRSPSDFNEDHIDNRVIALMRNFTGLQQNKSMIFLGDAREKILEYMRIHKQLIEANIMPPTDTTETSPSLDEIADRYGINAEYLTTNPIMAQELEELNRTQQIQETIEQERNQIIDDEAQGEKEWSLSKTKASSKLINMITPSTFDRTLNIDTRFRDNYESTNSNDFMVELNDEFKNVLSMEVVSIEVPNNRYQIEEGNNTFKISEVLFSGAINTYTIRLEPGNYGSSTNVVDYFTGDFNTEQYPEGNFRLFGQYDEVTEINTRFILRINDRTGFTEIYAKDITSKVILEFNENPNNKYKDIGFLLGYTNILYTGSNKYISEKIFQINGLSYFYLAIDDYNNNSIRSITNNLKNSNVSEDVISRFALIANRFGGNFDEKRFSGSTGRKRIYQGTVDIKKLHIRLLDEFGDPLDIKNGDWFITLLFRCQYTNLRET